jgi:hypothetical protein
LSSTNRGAVRSESDWYETQAVDAAPMLAKLTPLLSSAPSIFEPTAGRGALVRLLRAAFPFSHIDANEIDPERCETLKTAGATFVTNFDLFDDSRIPRKPVYKLAFTNPPFFAAQAAAEKLVEMAEHVVLLQRVNWLASLDRLDFWRKHAADVWLLPKRPSFAASLKCAREPKPCGWKLTQYLDSPRPKTCPSCQAKVLCATSDSIEYAWFHFHADSIRQYGHLGRITTVEQGDLLKGVA